MNYLVTGVWIQNRLVRNGLSTVPIAAAGMRRDCDESISSKRRCVGLVGPDASGGTRRQPRAAEGIVQGTDILEYFRQIFQRNHVRPI